MGKNKRNTGRKTQNQELPEGTDFAQRADEEGRPIKTAKGTPPKSA